MMGNPPLSEGSTHVIDTFVYELCIERAFIFEGLADACIDAVGE